MLTRAGLALAALLAAATALAGPGAEVALTFDDLPVHGELPPGRTRLEVIRNIAGTLRTERAPEAYGFVNARTLDDAAANAGALRAWRDAGLPLGNHAYSHMDLHTHTPAEFERDVLANEPVLRDLMGGRDWHWFRYPFLHEGETLEKRRAVRAALRSHGYRVAQVTISFDDWAYHDPYARCAARGDGAGLEWLEATYLAEADRSIAAAQEDARRLFGRDVRHVMLLHVGAFNEVVLRRLLALLRRRGFELVTLDRAQRDAAYADPPDLALAAGATLLDRLLAARGLERAERGDSPLPRLASLCR